VSRQYVHALLLESVTLILVGARATDRSIQSDAATVRGALSKTGAEICVHGAALIKVLLSYEHQTLPGNLHFNTPNPNNAGLKDGILKVVTEPTEFKQGIVALSNFGFGGEPASQLLLRLFLCATIHAIALPVAELFQHCLQLQ
jgi:hypothetical protein